MMAEQPHNQGHKQMDAGISRRSLLTTAGVIVGGMAITGLTACSQNPSIPEPTASPTGPIKDQLDQALKVISAGSDKFGVFIEDVRSGGTYSYNGGYASQSASMAKPMIVAMALRKARPADLPAAQIANAALAINQSDNNAATALWQYAGYSGYPELATALGMGNTHLDKDKPDQWSWTWTTPSDQVKLVKALATGKSDALEFAEAKFIYDQMGNVIPDQTWGVGQPKADKVEVHLKNGWVQFKSSDNLWAVNSMGSVVGEGRDYRMCVMTRVPDFTTGRDLTSMVGKWVFKILGSGKL
jgi:hypothetical protein